MNEMLQDKEAKKKCFWRLRLFSSFSKLVVWSIGLVVFFGTAYTCSISPALKFEGWIKYASTGVLVITNLYVFGARVIPMIKRLESLLYLITGRTPKNELPSYITTLVKLQEIGLLDRTTAKEYIDKYVNKEYPETSLPLTDLERIAEKVIEYQNKNTHGQDHNK